ncbi:MULTISPECIES: type III secretion system stator protein SctL [Rhodomicrobium]|uniref:type III secretion system stator protein SctL n=1 Tax=Rhodomicrobium TaxID=1068 RepID=UPI001481D8F7|nr:MULTISPECIES: type III secretion system stator protein SctL [Rhodomicrobium]
MSKELPRAPGVKIIRAGEENAWRDAYALLAEAKNAHAVERARGYAEGMAAASKDAGKLVAETAAKVDNYMASLEKEVGRLAFDIVRRVLSEFDDAELVARAARNALADFRDAKSVRLKIHPSAEAQVRRSLLAWAGERGGEPLPVSVETDDELDRRACILATEFAVVEATVDTQLAAIAEAMGLASGAGSR